MDGCPLVNKNIITTQLHPDDNLLPVISSTFQLDLKEIHQQRFPARQLKSGVLP
jgi:hypothetical protein